MAEGLSADGRSVQLDGHDWRLVTVEQAESIEEGCTRHTLTFLPVMLHSRLGLAIAPPVLIEALDAAAHTEWRRAWEGLPDPVLLRERIVGSLGVEPTFAINDAVDSAIDEIYEQLRPPAPPVNSEEGGE